MAKKQKPLVFVVVGIVAVAFLGLGGFWYMQQQGTENAEEVASIPVKEGEEGLGATLFERSQNEVGEEFPETNPFSAEVNPLDGIYTNPFE